MATPHQDAWLTFAEYRALQGLPAESLVAVGGGHDHLGRKMWDPRKHPRGRDGRFIEVGGLVKFFDSPGSRHVAGTGIVQSIDPITGAIHVKIHTHSSNPAMIDKVISVDKRAIVTVPRGEVRLDRRGNVHPDDRSLPDKNGKLVKVGDTVKIGGQTGVVTRIDDNSGRVVVVNHATGMHIMRRVETVERQDRAAARLPAAPSAPTLNVPVHATDMHGHRVPDGWTPVHEDGRDRFTDGNGYTVTPVTLPLHGEKRYNLTRNGIRLGQSNSWDSVEAKVADDKAGLAENAQHRPEVGVIGRDTLGQVLDRHGFSQTTKDAVKHGTSDEIKAAIIGDSAYAELKRKGQEAQMADFPRPAERQVRKDWEDVQAAAARGVRGAPEARPASRPAARLAPNPSPRAMTPSRAERLAEMDRPGRNRVGQALERQGFSQATKDAVKYGTPAEAKAAITNDPALADLQRRGNDANNMNFPRGAHREAMHDHLLLQTAASSGVQGPGEPRPPTTIPPGPNASPQVQPPNAPRLPVAPPANFPVNIPGVRPNMPENAGVIPDDSRFEAAKVDELLREVRALTPVARRGAPLVGFNRYTRNLGLALRDARQARSAESRDLIANRIDDYFRRAIDGRAPDSPIRARLEAAQRTWDEMRTGAPPVAHEPSARLPEAMPATPQMTPASNEPSVPGQNNPFSEHLRGLASNIDDAVGPMRTDLQHLNDSSIRESLLGADRAIQGVANDYGDGHLSRAQAIGRLSEISNDMMGASSRLHQMEEENTFRPMVHDNLAHLDNAIHHLEAAIQNLEHGGNGTPAPAPDHHAVAALPRPHTVVPRPRSLIPPLAPAASPPPAAPAAPVAPAPRVPLVEPGIRGRGQHANAMIRNRYGDELRVGVKVRTHDGKEGFITRMHPGANRVVIKNHQGLEVMRDAHRVRAQYTPAAPARPPAPGVPAPVAPNDGGLNVDIVQLGKIREQIPRTLNRITGGNDLRRRDYRNAGFALDDALDTSKTPQERQAAMTRAIRLLDRAASGGVNNAPLALEHAHYMNHDNVAAEFRRLGVPSIERPDMPAPFNGVAAIPHVPPHGGPDPLARAQEILQMHAAGAQRGFPIHPMVVDAKTHISNAITAARKGDHFEYKQELEKALGAYDRGLANGLGHHGLTADVQLRRDATKKLLDDVNNRHVKVAPPHVTPAGAEHVAPWNRPDRPADSHALNPAATPQDYAPKWGIERGEAIAKAARERPSFDALVADGLNNAERVTLAGKIFDGQYGSNGLQFTVTGVGTGFGDAVSIDGVIKDSGGHNVGTFQRTLYAGDKRWASNAFFQIRDDNLHGGGSATEFNRHLEDWYIANDFHYVKVSTGLKLGGYVWTRNGFDWTHKSSAREGATKALTYARNRGDHETAAQAQSIIDRIDQHSITSLEFPTPFEVGNIGWKPGMSSKSDMWAGRSVMPSVHWNGIKKLDPNAKVYKESVARGIVPDPAIKERQLTQYTADHVPNELRAISINDLTAAVNAMPRPAGGARRRPAVIGNFEIRRASHDAAAGEAGGVNMTYFIKDTTTGRRYIVKNDTSNSEAGARAEVAFSQMTRATNFYGASYVEQHPTSPSAIISTFAGEQVGASDHTLLGDYPRSAQEVLASMPDPKELLHARLLNAVTGNSDRHGWNAMFAQDPQGGTHLLLFDHGYAIRPQHNGKTLEQLMTNQLIAYKEPLIGYLNSIGREAGAAQFGQLAQELLNALQSQSWPNDAERLAIIRRVEEAIANPGKFIDLLTALRRR